MSLRLLLPSVLLCALTLSPVATSAGTEDTSPPRTPRGLPVCRAPLAPVEAAVASPGEVLVYDLEVMRLDVGTLELATGRIGTHRGEPVTELKGDLRVDRSVALLVPLEGSAASLVSARFVPVQAAHRYRWTTVRAHEMQTYSQDGREVRSKRLSDEGDKETARRFPMPVQDMLSGLYLLRALPRQTEGCTIIYSNQQAFTVWIHDEGEELVSTPWGKRMADRVKLRYASDENKKVKEALVWLSQDSRRVPYRAQGLNQYRPRATLKSYRAPAE